MNKSLVYLGGIVVIALIGGSVILQYRNSDENLLRKAIGNRWDVRDEYIEVKIQRQVGSWATGTAAVTDEPGSGSVWFALREEEEWIIITDGNGFPSCTELEPYNIPPKILQECYDEHRGELVPLSYQK